MMNKYGNKRVVVDGIRFDSKREAARWQELKLLERAGEIKGLERQVEYELIPKQPGERAVKYIADFRYIDHDGKTVVEDTKGVKTPVYILKRKLLLWVHGIRVVEV
jgi:hypothetical protein